MHGEYQRLTRQEMYDLVWSVPASKLSEQFGLSGRGLAKLCERHDIPVPERGWWAKTAAGKNVEKTPLRPATNPYLETIQLYVREDFRHWLSAEELAMFEERLAEEKAAAPPVVPTTDDSRHPVVVGSRKKLRNSASTSLHIDISVTKDLREEALCAAAGLATACETRGYSFMQPSASTDGVAAVKVFDQLVGLKIEEPMLNVPHVLTKSEAREKAVGRGWNIPKYDSMPSGQLAIVLDHHADGERRTFSNTAQNPIESVIGDVMKALVRIAMRLRAVENRRAERERREREAAELRRQEEQRRREEAARIAEERRRRRELLHQASRFRQTQLLRQLIAAVRETVASEHLPDDALNEWFAHATSVAESLDPLPMLLKTFRR